MIGLTSETTDEVSFCQRTTPYISVRRWSKYDKVPCLSAQARFAPTFFDCKSNTLASRLNRLHIFSAVIFSLQGGLQFDLDSV